MLIDDSVSEGVSEAVFDLSGSADSGYYDPYSLSEVTVRYLDGHLSSSDLTRCYRIWRDRNSFIVLRRWDSVVSQEVYKVIKASRRGNDVYCYRVRRGFGDLYDLCSESCSQALIPRGSRSSFSKVLFFTLTWNPSLCLDDSQASWRVVSQLLNEFVSKLKAEYGSVSILRVYEAFASGFPHVHMIVVFNDHAFPVRYHRVEFGKNRGVVQYLIPDSEDSFLHDAWFGQHVKAEALQSVAGVLYLLKYITKGMYEYGGGLTSALLWVHRCRSFGISGSFVNSLSVACFSSTRPIMRNSNGIEEESVSDSDYQFVGMVVLPSSVQLWHFLASDPPDPIRGLGYSSSFAEWVSQFADSSVLPEARKLNPNTLCVDSSDLSIFRGTYYPDR